MGQDFSECAYQWVCPKIGYVMIAKTIHIIFRLPSSFSGRPPSKGHKQLINWTTDALTRVCVENEVIVYLNRESDDPQLDFKDFQGTHQKNYISPVNPLSLWPMPHGRMVGKSCSSW